MTYLKYSSESFYKIHRFFTPIHGGDSETSFGRISADGTFLVPNISKSFPTQGSVLQGFIVVVITRLNAGIVTRYPPGVADKNSNELKTIGAFAEKFEVRDAQP